MARSRVRWPRRRPPPASRFALGEILAATGDRARALVSFMSISHDRRHDLDPIPDRHSSYRYELPAAGPPAATPWPRRCAFDDLWLTLIAHPQTVHPVILGEEKPPNLRIDPRA